MAHPAAPLTQFPANALTIGLMSGTSLDGVDGVLILWHSQARGFETLARAPGLFDVGLWPELVALFLRQL